MGRKWYLGMYRVPDQDAQLEGIIVRLPPQFDFLVTTQVGRTVKDGKCCMREQHAGTICQQPGHDKSRPRYPEFQEPQPHDQG